MSGADSNAASRPGGWQAAVRPLAVSAGEGSIDGLGDVAQALGGSRALIVSDPGIAGAGYVDRATESLVRAGLETASFLGVEENPTGSHCVAGAKAAEDARCDLIVGLGGGSSMDTAKGVNFLVAGGGTMEDYWGWGKAKGQLLPSIGVPCTAGTGSEAQSFALISRDQDHRKMACGDEQARFRHVILDPTLLPTAPREVVATTGVDALSHALESFVTRARNPFSNLHAARAWQLLDANFEEVLQARREQPDELGRRTGHMTAWSDMLLGAHFAGAAIELSMLGAAHALANPLTAAHGIAHGSAIGVVLPSVIRWNAEVIGELYQELDPRGGEGLAARVEELRAFAHLPSRLEPLGIEERDLPGLAKLAAEQWTGEFNPRPLDPKSIQTLYEGVF